jgi:hypothetical protein
MVLEKGSTLFYKNSVQIKKINLNIYQNSIQFYLIKIQIL